MKDKEHMSAKFVKKNVKAALMIEASIFIWLTFIQYNTVVINLDDKYSE